MTPENYRRAIMIADQNVKRAKEAVSSRSLPGSTEKSRSIMGRSYRVGDAWVVAVTHQPSVQMIRSRSAEGAAQGGLTGVFRYEVIEADESGFQVAVTQLAESGLKAVDSRVEKILFKFDPEMRQKGKSYVMDPRLKPDGEGVQVSPQGLRSSMTRLELLPLDVPALGNAEELADKADGLPVLPASLSSHAQASDWAQRARASRRMEHEDFFGRPVEILWQAGEPWPSYMKTSLGVAILIRKGVEQ